MRQQPTNTALESVGGTYKQDMPLPAYLRRMITSEVTRHVSRGIVRRQAKKSGKKETLEVRSIDAWRDEGGWTENQSFHAGDLEIPPHASNHDILKAMRQQGYLTDKSAGKVALDDHGTSPTYIWVINKSNHEPLFALIGKD
jgi:hypothetical protein